MLKCPKCGFENSDNAQFCQKCANVFNSENYQKQTKQPKDDQLVNNQDTNHKQIQPKNFKFKKPVFILLGILVLGGVASAGWYGYNKFFNNKNTTENQSQELNNLESQDSSAISLEELFKKEIQRFDIINDKILEKEFDFSSFKKEFEINPEMIQIDLPKDGYVYSENTQYLEVAGSYEDNKNSTGYSPYFAEVSLNDANKVLLAKNTLTGVQTEEKINMLIFASLVSEFFDNKLGVVSLDTEYALSYKNPVLVFQIEDKSYNIIARKIVELSKDKKDEADLKYKKISIPELNIEYQIPENFKFHDLELNQGVIHNWYELKDSYLNNISVTFENNIDMFFEKINIDFEEIANEMIYDLGSDLDDETKEKIKKDGEETQARFLEEKKKDAKKISEADYLLVNKITNNKINFDFQSTIVPQDDFIRWRMLSSDKKFLITINFNNINEKYIQDILIKTINSIQYIDSSNKDINKDKSNLDSDNDGLTDDMEKFYGSDPYFSDTDGDGYLDGEEVENGYDPIVPGSARLEDR